MSHKIVALITSLIVVGAARPATPQVAKPTALPGGAEPTARLPAPQKMTAQQRTDGRILVAWSPVEGAVQYRLTRSVPPGGILPVSLPDPSDTQYVDQDVRPGSTYYYAVAAVDQGGSVGLKIGSQPVTATDLTPVPAAPTGVRAELRGSTASISWNFVPGIRYQIERASFSGANPSSWLPLPAPSTCCLLDKLGRRGRGQSRAIPGQGARLERRAIATLAVERDRDRNDDAERQYRRKHWRWSSSGRWGYQSSPGCCGTTIHAQGW